MLIARRFLVAVALTALSAGLTAADAQQGNPSPAQAAAMLQSRPEVASQVRQRIQSSGLSQEQIRARLRAEGYPEDLLDAYMGTASQPGGAPSQDVLSAMRALGIVDSLDTQMFDQMRVGREGRETPMRRVIPLDTLGRTPFGLSLFRGSTSLFLPNQDGPVDANYRVGPGDQLVLILTGDVELAYTLDITREGFVVIPQVGQLPVANLTLAELDNLLYTRLSRVYSGVQRGDGATTRFSVSVSRLRSNQVFVAGDAVTPGSYRVSSAGTALTALYAAGGPSDQGSLRRIEVRRGGRVVSTLDVYDYLLRGDASRDVRLQQGDVVFVPVHGQRARIYGAVTRPATYEIRSGESLDDLIQFAGGLTAEANARRVVIERILPAGDRTDGRDRIVIDAPLMRDRSGPGIALENGDVVRVLKVGERVRGQVVVTGNVHTPGDQGYTPGLTLSEALSRAGGVRSDTYLPTVHVSRLLPSGVRVQLRASLRDTTGTTVESFGLQEDDSVTVYGVSDFRPDEYVVIAGAVRNGGRYPWRDGMTLRDLVLMANGMTEAAYVREVEIARVPEPRTANVTAISLRVPIDSSYLARDWGRARETMVADIPLRPYDNVLVLQDPDWQPPRQVTVTGEVKFPGTYTLQTRGERVVDVVRRAGGVTSQGDLGAAFFSRLSDFGISQRLTEQRQRRLGQLIARDSTLSETKLVQSRAVLEATADTTSRIRVGISIAEALRRPSSNDNLLLVDGDSLHVPLRRQVVEVRGAVNAPTAITHTGNRSLGYYIGAAGGYAENARGRRAYVIQPDGRIESRRHLLWAIRLDPTPRPGAAVVVPEKLPGERQTNVVATVSLVSQLVATLATLIAISR